MTRLAALAALLLAGCQTVAPPQPVAEARPPAITLRCAPVMVVLRALLDEFAELPVARGMSHGNTAVMVVASASGSWTILHLTGNGLACVLASGVGWEAVSSGRAPGVEL